MTGRRDFLLSAAMLRAPDAQYVVEARHYEKLANRKIKCKLCPRECVIDDHERGYCGVRENRGGTYYSLVYGRVAAAHVDPIEKKPFFHFLPGSQAFSIATAGCNVNCKFCQNWDISQSRPEQIQATEVHTGQLVTMAKQNRCASIAYTYSEPVIFYEYMSDAAEAGRKAGVRSAVVSNGYIQKKPLEELVRRVDAIKVDLKAFSEKFYREVVNGELKPVLDSLVTIRRAGVWNEIVYLVIPTLNDKEAEFRELAKWVKTELGPDVPVHFTRYYPQYLLKNLAPTPVETLERAKAICDAEGLHYVYVGNVAGHPGANTRCPRCRKTIVERTGLTLRNISLKNGRCPHCQTTIPGIWT